MGAEEEWRPIVVGVDGSTRSRAALDWAVHEAALRHSPLRILHANLLRDEALALFEEEDEFEREVLEAAVERARRAEPKVTVVGQAVGPPADDALVAASSGAQLLVVGSRGLGTVRGFVLGSVSQACVNRAHCPVVVVGDSSPDESLRAPGDRTGG